MHNSQSSPNCAEVPTATESDDRFEMAPLLLPSTPPRSNLADTAAFLLANHRQSAAATMVITDNGAHRPLLFHKRPQKQRLFTESNMENLSASLHGLSSIHRPSSSSSRSAGYSGPLQRRHNKSCDWSPPHSHNENCEMCGAGCGGKSGLGTFLPQNDAISLRSFNNPIAQVRVNLIVDYDKDSN
ncbi:hypothetical protein Ddc_08973 [Ditylenchus destructor]|nr:hypothetical protein Ddc_08973 [Ditylenchus destructor]